MQVQNKESKLNSHVQGRMAAAPERVPQVFWCPDLVSTRDLGPAGVDAVLRLAAILKSRPADFRRALTGKQIVMFFEKPSLRTRLTFEAGIVGLGGTAMFVDQTHERLDAREKLSDVRTTWSAGSILLCCAPTRSKPSRAWRSTHRSR